MSVLLIQIQKQIRNYPLLRNFSEWGVSFGYWSQMQNANLELKACKLRILDNRHKDSLPFIVYHWYTCLERRQFIHLLSSSDLMAVGIHFWSLWRLQELQQRMHLPLKTVSEDNANVALVSRNALLELLLASQENQQYWLQGLHDERRVFTT